MKLCLLHTPTRYHQDNDEGGPASTTTPIVVADDDETEKKNGGITPLPPSPPSIPTASGAEQKKRKEKYITKFNRVVVASLATTPDVVKLITPRSAQIAPRNPPSSARSDASSSACCHSF